jgi:hypothetical protein
MTTKPRITIKHSCAPGWFIAESDRVNHQAGFGRTIASAIDAWAWLNGYTKNLPHSWN